MIINTNHTSSKIKAIETRYKGYRFRSRLEARWAVFFDALGIKWSYEAEGYDLGEYGWYLPDFYLPQVDRFCEIKPTVEAAELERNRHIAFVKMVHSPLLLLIEIPDIAFYECISKSESGESSSHLEFISTYRGYHISEHRFYSCPGSDNPVEEGIVSKCDESAVVAARSARFEHGESP